MQLKFDSNQQYQLDAIQAVLKLFDGQRRLSSYDIPGQIGVQGNHLTIDEPRLLGNTNSVQLQQKLKVDSELFFLTGDAEFDDSKREVRFPNFSVEMETGTGKTYVYLRTILELNKQYGFSKFIIVVPSVAIREGVLKSLQITRNHFTELYENIPYRFYVYDSENIAQIRQFALSGNVEIMIMTLDSFNKDDNVIKRSTDRLLGEIPIQLVQKTRPILILDEPQNMESEKSIAALASLNPLLALRYSATHRNPYNLIYRLTPYDAYKQGLVKKIEVASVIRDNDFNHPFIAIQKLETKKKTVSAKITLNKLLRDGRVKEETLVVFPGDSLESKSNLPQYAGYDVAEISLTNNKVLFSNGFELGVGEITGAHKESIFEEQIRYTLEEHFRKQQRLKSRGIKVLSLFFIDRVDNYANDDGIIRKIFDRQFSELKKKYTEWKGFESSQVREGYFAGKRVKGGQLLFEDSTSGNAKKDEEAYKLIMKEKERLLSLNEPVSFIFSHSALREGWDNPNIFQICTLNQSVSEIRKRQEIGRGLRLCVNQSGERVIDDQLNVLTVIANESYEKYVEQLQSEIREEYGDDGVPPKPANANRKTSMKLKKEFMLKPEFMELWERIKHKTRYSVTIDTDKLVKDVGEKVRRHHEISLPTIKVEKAEIQTHDNQFEAFRMASRKIASQTGGDIVTDVVSMMSHILRNTTPPIVLTRRTLYEIYTTIQNKELVLANPYHFATIAASIIKEELNEQLIGGLKYEKINEWYEMTLFESRIDNLWEDYLVPASKSLYDNVEFDSDVEKKFVEGLEKRLDVRMYVKLPRWFTVPTPVGNYNPDWAIVIENRDEHGQIKTKPLLYLVRETKATSNISELAPNERRKVLCGKKHFEDTLGVSFAVVKDAAELLE